MYCRCSFSYEPEILCSSYSGSWLGSIGTDGVSWADCSQLSFGSFPLSILLSHIRGGTTVLQNSSLKICEITKLMNTMMANGRLTLAQYTTLACVFADHEHVFARPSRLHRLACNNRVLQIFKSDVEPVSPAFHPI